MQPEKTARYADERERILAVAGERLARDGVQGLDLAEIATEIGLRRSSLTYYFANVEALAAEILSARITEIRLLAAEAARCPSPAARIRYLFDSEIAAFYLWREGQAPRRQQLGELRALKPALRRQLGAQYRALLAEVAGLLAPQQDQAQRFDCDEAIAAHLVLENLFWLPAWLEVFHPWESGYVSGEVVRLLLDGLIAPPLAQGRPPIPVCAPHDSHAASPDAFLRAATRLVCESGYRGASIDRIASELNVTKGSFYHHIAMKDDLVEICFLGSFDRLANLQRLAEAAENAPGDQLLLALRSIVRAQFDGQFPFLRSSALPGLESGLRARIIERAQRSIRWLSGKLGAAMRQNHMAHGDHLIAAQMLYIAANAAFDLGRARRDDTGLAESRYLELMLCGILPQSRVKDAKAS